MTPVMLDAIVTGLKPGAFRGNLGFVVDGCRSDELTTNWSLLRTGGAKGGTAVPLVVKPGGGPPLGMSSIPRNTASPKHPGGQVQCYRVIGWYYPRSEPLSGCIDSKR